MKYCYTIILLMISLLSSAQLPDTTFLKNLLESHPELFSHILNHPAHNEVQILYTQIDRDENNLPHFKSYSYRLNAHHYFYPASTVKLPTAIFALEKLNELNIPHLDKNTVMKTPGGVRFSAAGQNNRYNAIQVDGTDMTDRFGLATSQEPGGQSGGRAMTLEAVKEYQVLALAVRRAPGKFHRRSGERRDARAARTISTAGCSTTCATRRSRRTRRTFAPRISTATCSADRSAARS